MVKVDVYYVDTWYEQTYLIPVYINSGSETPIAFGFLVCSISQRTKVPAKPIVVSKRGYVNIEPNLSEMAWL